MKSSPWEITGDKCRQIASVAAAYAFHCSRFAIIFFHFTLRKWDERVAARCSRTGNGRLSEAIARDANYESKKMYRPFAATCFGKTKHPNLFTSLY